MNLQPYPAHGDLKLMLHEPTITQTKKYSSALNFCAFHQGLSLIPNQTGKNISELL
jgi:hypothetical protein